MGHIGTVRSRSYRIPRARSVPVAAWRAAVKVTARGLGLVGAALVGCALLLVWHVFLDQSGLPDLAPFMRFEVPVTGHVYDARGEVLATLATERRSMVAYADLPPVLENALLAAEDKRFFSHSGVDLLAFPRVVARNLLSDIRSPQPGRRFVFAQGGSTLTQQFVRGWFLRELTSRERLPVLVSRSPGSRLAAMLLDVPAANRLVRKLEEIRIALWLERELERRLGSKRLAKEAILVRYANWVYLGRGGHGFAEAARYYFGRPLASFTEADAPEAALLAGLVRSAMDSTDARSLARSLRRRNDVLALMVKAG
jgi:penicillin-binding protein 1A